MYKGEKDIRTLIENISQGRYDSLEQANGMLNRLSHLLQNNGKEVHPRNMEAFWEKFSRLEETINDGYHLAKAASF